MTTSSVSYEEDEEAEEEADLRAARRASAERDMVISLEALDWIRYDVKRESTLICLDNDAFHGHLTRQRSHACHSRPNLYATFVGIAVANDTHLRLPKLDDAFLLKFLNRLDDS